MVVEIDYTEEYPKMVYDIEPDIWDLILEKDEDVQYQIEDSGLNIFEVETPFVVPGNYFDMRECNITEVVINAHETKRVTFPGGNQYSIYERTDLNSTSAILYGNSEEGFNLFILK